MADLSSNHVLKEVEIAINSKNYGRMYDLGVRLVKESTNDNSWLEAAVIISGYLVKSTANIWNAVDLSRRAALAAPPQSRYQELTEKSLIACINTLPEAKQRMEAAYSVVTVVPKDSSLLVVCIEIMLDNVSAIDDVKERKRYLKIIIHYSPKTGSYIERAEIYIREADKAPEPAKPKPKDNSPLLGFIDQHQENITELFKEKKKD